MEATPEYLDYTEIMETFLGIPGVVRVHNLRIWVRITRNDFTQSFAFDLFLAALVVLIIMSLRLAVLWL